MTTKIDLTGKTAAIIGAGRGIGKAVAITLAKAGANVWIGSRKEEQSKQVVKRIQEMGFNAGYSVIDVSNIEDTQRFLNEAENFSDGKIDIVVNNAGLLVTTPFLDTSVEQIKTLFDVNIIGSSNVLQCAIKKMIPNKSGKIVMTTSFAGQKGLATWAHYCASKAATISLIQSGAEVAAPYNINVNSVAPGIIRTDMWESILNGLELKEESKGKSKDEIFDSFIESFIPLNRPQTEQDIANAILFLCSDLSNEITGQTINVDGGAVMH